MIQLFFKHYLIMKKGEKIKVYFKRNGRCYKLFNIIQLGNNGDVDLKITDYYNNFIIKSKNESFSKGYLTEDELDKSDIIEHAEMSYHKDGSFLHKTKHAKYMNPYGEGERWTPTSNIKDFQPILNIAIRNMEVYNKSIIMPKHKNKEKVYICENDDLFEKTGTYVLILYIRNIKHTVNCFTTSKVYSDVITKLNHELELCIFIQRHSFPKAKKYYSKRFGCIINPTLCNSINFCNKELAKDEMRETLNNNVFNSQLHDFLNGLADNKFINLSEDKLQIIDQIDILYSKTELNMVIKKPLFIKFALKFFEGNISNFNELPQTSKELILNTLEKEIVKNIKLD